LSYLIHSKTIVEHKIIVDEMSQGERDNELIAHYHKHLGLEVRSIRFGERPAPSPGSITVLEFAPPSPDFDWVYVTVGASREPMPDPEGSAGHPTGRRFELIMLSNERQDALPEVLEALAAYPLSVCAQHVLHGRGYRARKSRRWSATWLTSYGDTSDSPLL